MRVGQNPLKEAQKPIDRPESITVGVLNFIPDQSGYFRGQLDSLKLCLASLRAHADRPFDLLVVDNGSCAEVRGYVVEELQAGRIDMLILNKRNLGKMNAQMQILHATSASLIFYSDGDIYYRPGWMQAHLEVLNAFPEVGLVGGIPLRNQANCHTESTRRWADNKTDKVHLEKGNLIPEEWTRDFLRSVGEERFIENWIQNEDWRMTRQGVIAYIGASHMQFLIPRNAINAIPQRRFSQALNTEEDQHLDYSIEEAGFLRLSAAEPLVYHIGNTISEPWLVDQYLRLVNRPHTVSRPAQGKSQREQHPHWFWGRWKILRALKAIYLWAFMRYYENT